MVTQRKYVRWKFAGGLLLLAAVAILTKTSSLGTLLAADPPAKTPETKTPPTESNRAADEKSIRATADDFVKAFNAADGKAVGALWAEDAEYTDESGASHHGRAAIEGLYTGMFKEHPGSSMAVTIESIRFLGPDIAVEKGIAKVKAPSGESSAARYTVVHARRDGKWIMVDCRDAPYVPGSNEDYLKGLEWLIGEWTTESKDADPKEPVRRVKFEWMCERNFIKCSYTMTKDDKTTLSGGQIIGWNPKLGRIVSLHFDANGGFGNDVWIKDGAKWVLEAKGVFRDGSDSTAVNILTPLDANSFTWQSVKRTLDGVRLPDTPPVRIVRVKTGT
jgi:uncharacterized protein (TIGR02246 family)